MAEENTATAEQTTEAPQQQGGVSKFVKDAQSTVGKKFTPTNIASKVADGDYSGAAVGIGIYAGFQSKTWELVEKAAPKIAEYGGKVLDAVVDVARKPQILAEAIGEGAAAGKRIPVIGAALTAGFVVRAVGKEVEAGNYIKASTELSAGCAEAIGNLAGFGIGDAAREAIRKIIVETSGTDYAPSKSTLRGFLERANRLVEKSQNGMLTTPEEIKAAQDKIVKDMTSDELPIKNAAYHDDDEGKKVPETLMINGKETALADALRIPEYNRRVREYLESMASRKSGYDTSEHLAALDRFNLLEEKRKSMTSATQPPKMPYDYVLASVTPQP